MPSYTQVSILKGLIAGGVTSDDEPMFVRLTNSHFVTCRVMSIKVLRQFGKKYWDRLFDMAKSDPNAEVKNQAIRALVNIDSTTAHKVLIKLLEDNSEERIKNTISSLIQKHEEFIRELLVDEKQLLQSAMSDLQSPDQRVRRKASRTLGQLKHVSAVQTLCDTLKDEDGIVRATAAEALESIGDNAPLFSLIEVLENDSCHHARAAAAKALGRCGQVGYKRVLDALLNGLNDSNGIVRKWCSDSLRRLRG
jgi:HEAT repeat protein